MEDIIYQKDAVIDILEFTMPNATESNEIPQLLSNISTVLPNRTNYTTQGKYNLNANFADSYYSIVTKKSEIILLSLLEKILIINIYTYYKTAENLIIN